LGFIPSMMQHMLLGSCMASVCILVVVSWTTSGGSSHNVSCCDTMASSSLTMLQASTTSTIIQGHVPDKGLAVAAVTATNVIPDINSIKLPTTCSTLGLDVDASDNHEVAVFPLVEAVFEGLNSENLYVEAASKDVQRLLL
ncbi:hypothetical protein BAE44_0000634, partial [Dichanthelium oligosanthes]